MRTLSALFILSFIFTLSSCEKWKKKEKDAYFYYSTDFKPVDLKSGAGTILNINIDDIDILYTVFFYERKVWRYKLVVENSDIQNGSDKSDKFLAYEEGEANVDGGLNILFIPDSNPSDSYSGYFEKDKEHFKVSLPGLYNREINFLKN
jgi:hypothetical protein